MLMRIILKEHGQDMSLVYIKSAEKIMEIQMHFLEISKNNN